MLVKNFVNGLYNCKTLSEAYKFIKYEQVTNQSDSENIRLINKDGNKKFDCRYC